MQNLGFIMFGFNFQLDTLFSRPKKNGQGLRNSHHSFAPESDLNDLERQEELRVEQFTDDEVNEKFEEMLVSEYFTD